MLTFSKALDVAKSLFSILLLVCSAETNANAIVEEGCNQIQHIFDKTIQQFMRQLDSTEYYPAIDPQRLQMELSLSDVATVLYEIEQHVVNKFVAKCSGHKVEMNFHDILNTINAKVHEKINKPYRQSIEELESLKLKLDEAEIHLLRSEANNDALFHQLLTFAIRLGFHTGQDLLNYQRKREEAPNVNLHKFVHALNCLEEIYPNLKESKLAVVVMHGMQHGRFAKLDFSPGHLWNEWQIQYNLGTIKWLVLNSPGVPIEGWIQMVKKIHSMALNGHFPDDVGKPLEHLMVGWTGRKDMDGTNLPGLKIHPAAFCALKGFGLGLGFHLFYHVEKVKKYFANKVDTSDKFAAELHKFDKEYRNHCGDGFVKLRLEMARDGIKYEQLAYNEIFMHYEDAIAYNELM